MTTTTKDPIAHTRNRHVSRVVWCRRRKCRVGVTATCLKCGSESWDNAFVYCAGCEDCFVHRYCLDIIPDTLDEIVTWYCEDCQEDITEAQHGSGCMNMDIDSSDMFEDNHSSKSMENEDESRLIPDHLIHSSSRNGQPRDSTETEDKIFEDAPSHGLHSDHKHNPSSNSMENINDSRLVPYTHDSVQDHLLHSSYTNGSFQKLQTSYQYQENPRLICNSNVTHISYLPNPTSLQQDHHIPAQPVQDPVWRGAFVIINKNQDTYDGFVAHISNKACSKVCEKANSLKTLLHFEMHPKSDVWPKGFQDSNPSDDHIALYFLPSDTSGEKVFDNLVEYMMGHELALKATVENAELLLFTSIELPLAYWRFQGKYYLWGVFRGKQAA